MKKNQFVFFEDSIDLSLKSILIKDSPQKIFLVTGEKSYKKCGAKKIMDKALKKHSFIRFSEFNKNPKVEDVEKGIKLFKKNNCDYVIAVGGGSVIDMAKLINAGQSINSNIKDVVLNNTELSNPCKKILAIPTTSGAGSEATHFAVVYINSKKYSLAHKYYLLPDVVFLSPYLTHSTNAYQTAVSGADALAQSIESYWSINSNEESKEYSSKALKLIIKNLPNAVNNNCKEAKKNMMLAAYMAGKAINISKTTGAHAMGYIFTTKFNIPHGHAVALTIHEWFRYNNDINNDDILDLRGIKYVRKTIKELSKLINEENIKPTNIFIKNFLNNIGLETSLKKLDININNLDFILKNINLERLKNNPININSEGLKSLLLNTLN